MEGIRAVLFVFLVFFVVRDAKGSEILCQEGFCRTYGFDVGCASPAQECRINNATHSGLWMLSPTPCNCCEFCLPFYGEGHHCSLGGPGLGTTVGRCGDGLTCQTSDEDGENYCTRMESVCHSAQDEYDERHEQGEVGALESRPNCDEKGKYGVYDCVPTQTVDPRRFYGHNKHTNPIPKNGLSDDDLASDSDTDIPASSIPIQRHVIIPETDDEFSDEDCVPLANLPSTSKNGKNVRRKKPIPVTTNDMKMTMAINCSISSFVMWAGLLTLS